MTHQPIQWINNTPKNYVSVLYIGNPANHFRRTLSDALDGYGHLSLSIHAQSKLINDSFGYHCYILDADTLTHLDLLIHRIRDVQPDARILIVTDHPDWYIAREVFRAGAINYVSKGTHHLHVRATLKHTLRQQLPQKKRQSNANI